MSNLTQRIITAIFGIAIVLTAILYSEITCLILIAFISTMSLIEFYKLNRNENIYPQTIVGVVTGLLMFVPLALSKAEMALNLLPLLIILPYLVFIRELYTKAEKPFTNIAFTLLGNLYISLPLFLFFLLGYEGAGDHFKSENILGFFFILWASDTGAYFAGRFLGKHKLFERISPKKTWEGFIGGAVLALVVAFVIGKYFIALRPDQWLGTAIIIVITGSLGDLVESMYKRSIDIKDSGSILPGHGGFLDRFDGLFISVPFVFTYLMLSR